MDVLFHESLFDKKTIKIEKNTLQGDRIETPSYILENKNKIKINYSFYITNQILKPVCQIYGLIVEHLDPCYRFPYEKNYYKKEFKKLLDNGKELDKTIKKVSDMREKMARQLLFDPIVNQIEKRKALSKWARFGFHLEK